ncbi:MAG TPA: nucleotidyltransferase family protein [Thermoanaerobaculia bacterium]|nr:nucleotidyltransferase family protein [Thermoanaerobaculia bacterium]
MKGMILAAGFGTRLRPLTYTMPKPMVPLCGKPLIAYAVDSFLDAGIDDIVVNLHHLPEQIERFLSDTYRHRATFFFSREEGEILGTGGGLRRVRAHLEREEFFFVVNADTVQFPRYDALRDALLARNALAALTLRHPPAHDKFTAVPFRDGLVTGFGKGEGEPLMFAGSHCISSRIFRYIPDREFSGIVEHAYQPVLDRGEEVIAGVLDDGPWFDIGKPSRYLEAARGLCGEESSVWEGAFVAPSVKLERCIVAGGVQLEQGDYRDCVIMKDDPAIPREEYERVEGNVIARIT